MQEQENIRVQARKKGAEATKGKGKGNLDSGVKDAIKELKKTQEDTSEIIKVSPKEKKLQDYNIDSMLNAFIYIHKITVDKGKVITITLNHFDIFNKQDLYHIALCISAVYLMFKRYFNNQYAVKIVYNVVCYDQVAQDNLESDAKKKGVINPRTKEKSKIERIKELFSFN